MDEIQTLDLEISLLDLKKIAELKVMKKNCIHAKPTDLCLLTGVDSYGLYYLNEINHEFIYEEVLYGRGKYNDTSYYIHPESRHCAIRPTIYCPKIFSHLYPTRVTGEDGVEEVEFGEYPQIAADTIMQQILNNEYNQNNLVKTGRNYTLSINDEEQNKYDYIVHDEYEYNGKTYIRIKANVDAVFRKKLSTGVKCASGEYIWVEVLPVKWLIDENEKLFISKYSLLSGVKYCDYI